MQEKDWILLEEVDYLFRKVVRRFVKERDKVSVEGISLPGLLILNTILREGDQRLGDLAEQLDFTSGAVTALCDKLEASGFAIRKRSDTDRRSVVLGITPSGNEMIMRNKDSGSIIIDEIFGCFTHKELESAATFLKRLNVQLEGLSDNVITRIEATVNQITAESVNEYEGRSDSELDRPNRFISY